MIDVNLDEYFSEEFNEWDKINKVILNPARRSHRERFVEVINEQLQLYSLEEDLKVMEEVKSESPTSTNTYYGVGHSLGGAILDLFIEKGFSNFS